MSRYKVFYKLVNDYDMIVDAKDDEDAKEKVIDKADPNNQYDWVQITGITKLKEGVQE